MAEITGVNFDSFINADELVSFEGAKEALESQTAFFNELKKSVDLLRDSGLSDAVIDMSAPEQLIQFAREAQGLDADALREKIGGINKAFGELSTVKVEDKDLLADVKSGYSKGMQELEEKMRTEDIPKLVKSMENPSGAQSAAEVTMNSYISTLMSKGNQAVLMAQSVAKRVAAALNSSAGENLLKKFKLNTDTPTYDIGLDDQKASGGIAKGGLTLVGENGPELIVLNGGERVFNNADTENILSSLSRNMTGGGQYFTVNPQSVNNAVNNYSIVQGDVYDNSKTVELLAEIAGNTSADRSVEPPVNIAVDLSMLDSILSKYKSDFGAAYYHEDVYSSSEDSLPMPARTLGSEPSERVSRMEIAITIEGRGKVSVGAESGISKEELIELLNENICPVLVTKIADEAMGEGDSSYDT